MVRSRQFWLKSTKIRSPRSSFHQSTVTPSSRRASSRPKPIAACRTSRNSQRGSIRTKMWMPRLPEVFGVADAARAPPAARARRRPPARRRRTSCPGCGSRSMRSSSGRSTSLRRTGHGWKVSVPMCAHHTGHRDLGRADLLGGPPGREGDLHRLEVVGRALGHPLLVERVGVPVHPPGRQLHALAYAGRPALQRGRPVAERAHQPVLDDREVLRDHQLGHLGRGVGRLVDHPVRAGHADGAAARLDLDGGGLRHGASKPDAPDGLLPVGWATVSQPSHPGLYLRHLPRRRPSPSGWTAGTKRSRAASTRAAPARSCASTSGEHLDADDVVAARGVAGRAGARLGRRSRSRRTPATTRPSTPGAASSRCG